MKLENLNTEQRNMDTIDIDRLNTLEVLEKINNEDLKVAKIMQNNLAEISDVIDYIWPTFEKGRLFYVGAGTSGRLAVVDSSECPPTFGVSEDKVVGVIAGGIDAIFNAKEGVEDSLNLCEEDLKAYNFSKNDILIGIAASGRTPYVIGGLKYANSLGSKTVAISNVSNSEISSVAKKSIEIITGPEAITGSTRMKAGTSQKLVLNMISTTLMIKLGKVYTNLMVDIQPKNEKLVNRSYTIIMQSVDCELDVAKDLFIKSDKNVKVAIVMGILNLDKENAEKLLETNSNISKLIHDSK